MSPGILLFGLVLGANVGWQPLPDREGMECLIQISPEELELLRMGETWVTDIPPSAGDVRSYRLTVGTEALPRIAPPPAPPRTENELPFGDSTPSRILPSAEAKPMPEVQASSTAPYLQNENPAAHNAELPPSSAVPDNGAHPPHPWMLLVGTALALAGSLSGNAYLFWMLREVQRRHRGLAEDSPGQ